jgi:MAF protein
MILSRIAKRSPSSRGEHVVAPNAQPRIVLASASPRRRELLSSMGIAFEVVSSDIDEASVPGESPPGLARRLSLAKALAVARCLSNALVIAADTLVVIDGEMLGKPTDQSMAFEMLSRLRGREHRVYSGLALVDARTGRRCTQVAMTPVMMRDYTEDEIRAYVDTGDPLDKAGAYAIQYPAFDPVAQIDGCYANVMGLPMCHLYRALRHGGLEVPTHPLDCCPQAMERGCPWAEGIIAEPPSAWCDAR